jgi:vancomycin resistance protein YoaR
MAGAVDAEKALLQPNLPRAFAAGTVGRTVNLTATIEAMNTAISAQKSTAVAMVDSVQPSTSTADTNTLGITELVAEGVTDFKGSPSNRRFNLSYGAKKLNGVLMKPGETLSLISTLGKIDGAHGWKPELVIKGSKITPEFGGGLCQVATTLFRAALNAGLPIVERTNHSLRISYYEPPVGLDATIYEPKPDLRFTNNYSTPLLIQTEVKGTKLYFRMYGTKDGRSVDLPTPKVFNKVGIPATKYIEVDTLKPGEMKCQKPGHPGADAIATYTVTYADGTKKVQTFKSHYRAIGVICQVGKKAAEAPPAST